MKIILTVAVTMLATAAIAQTTMTRDGTNGTTGTTPTTSDTQATGTTGTSTTDVGSQTNPDSSAMQPTTNESTEMGNMRSMHGHRHAMATSGGSRSHHRGMRHHKKRHHHMRHHHHTMHKHTEMTTEPK